MFGQVTSINVNKNRGMIRGIDNGTGRELPFTPSDMADPTQFGPSLYAKKVQYNDNGDNARNVRLVKE
jgi:hypothetical protein